MVAVNPVFPWNQIGPMHYGRLSLKKHLNHLTLSDKMDKSRAGNDARAVQETGIEYEV